MNLLLVVVCILGLLHVSQTKVSFPPYVWVYWDSNFTEMPTFFKECHKANKKMLIGSKWQIKQVTDLNLNEYFKEEELKAYNELVNEFSIKQIKADLLRMLLLEKYGGVYMDVAGGYLVENLDWIDQIDENPHEMLQIKEKPEIILFGSTHNQYEIFRPKDKVLNSLVYENGFIAAMKGSRLMNDWIAAFIANVKERIKKKMDFGYFFTYDVRQHLTSQKIAEIQSGKYPQYKMFYEYYRMASISDAKCLYFSRFYSEFNLYSELTTKWTVHDLIHQYNFTCRYWKKQNHFENAYFKAYFQKNITLMRKQNQLAFPLYYQLTEYLPFLSKYKCLGQMYFVENSLLYNILLQNQSEFTEEIYNKQQLPLICQFNLDIKELSRKIILFGSIFYLFGFFHLFSFISSQKDNLQKQKIKINAAQKINIQKTSPEIRRLEEKSYEMIKNDENQDEQSQNLSQNIVQTYEIKKNIMNKSWQKIQKSLLFLIFFANIFFKMYFGVKLQIFSTFISVLYSLLILWLLLKLKKMIFCDKTKKRQWILYNLAILIMLRMENSTEIAVIKEVNDGNSIFEERIVVFSIAQHFFKRYIFLGYFCFRILLHLKLFLQRK